MECPQCEEGSLSVSNPPPACHICCDSCDFMDEWDKKYERIKDTFPAWVD